MNSDVFSPRFDPGSSKTLRYIKHGQFLLQYADNSALKGYEANDVVQLGDYFTFTKFGGITSCNSPDFQRVNGILGFGLPQTMPMALPGMPTPRSPSPSSLISPILASRTTTRTTC
jgi:hypothetical protein